VISAASRAQYSGVSVVTCIGGVSLAAVPAQARQTPSIKARASIPAILPYRARRQNGRKVTVTS
jgi:hypothetical protein